MDSPRIPSAAGVSSPRCFSDPPFTPTGGSRVAMMDRHLIRQAARPQGNPYRTPGAQSVP
jgi:hypothetical protein